MDFPNITGEDVLIILGILIAIGLILSMLLAAWVFSTIRRIHLPPNADLFTALRATPIAVVLLIDLLDLSLDFLSAPVAWVILDRLGLKPLRAISVVESIIPGTQLLPTMTAMWVFVRVYKGRSPF
jgi:hypothetical protein